MTAHHGYQWLLFPQTIPLDNSHKLNYIIYNHQGSVEPKVFLNNTNNESELHPQALLLKPQIAGTKTANNIKTCSRF